MGCCSSCMELYTSCTQLISWLHNDWKSVNRELGRGLHSKHSEAGIPHTPVETLGKDFQDNKSRCTFSVFDSSVELKSQVHPQDELLQDHLVPPESSDEEPQVPAPAHADVPPAEFVPTATAAPSPALTPQQEPGPETPSPPAAELQLLVAPQQVPSLELYLGPTLDPYLQFLSLTDLVTIVFIVTLISQRQANDRII
ncbi:uncharacterized protein LOC110350019 isoform X3 [Heterocephalus glaber]|uniref:Uncharacterized protein LOC110350019 isoform X3 n=1 Tax=Heterocephalus glaber TaxID=10181 RepID=A0AAX6T5L9_HETGA|nr:uncharacterized protein LOC110350019 isoform X3 [Heterocephalus glaber]